MAIENHIIPECFIDTKLVKQVSPPQRGRYNHQKGCSNVVKTMQEKLGDDFALGIVDRDKRSLGYAEEFDVVFDYESNIQLFKHREKHHYLIFICPAIEKWIIKNADEVNISLTDFGLPHEFKSLTYITKTSKSESEDEYSDNFKQLFRELIDKEPKAIMLLKFWIDALKNTPYQIDLNYLKVVSENLCTEN